MRVQEQYELSEVFRRLISSRNSSPGAPVTFDAFKSSSAISVLESAITFQPQIPQPEHRLLINTAIFAAAANEVFDAECMVKELRKAEDDYLKKPLSTFILASSLGLYSYNSLSGQIKRRRVNGALFTIDENLPKTIDRDGIKDDLEEHLVNSPANMAQCTVKIQSRTPIAAYHHAIDRIDLLRGMWNFKLNRTTAMRFSFGLRPVNTILPGPVHSIHLENGKLARESFWYEPQPIAHNWLYRVDDKWTYVEKFAKDAQSRLTRIRYAADVESAFIRYARSLDPIDPGLAFVRLWAVLEFLTGTIGDYKSLIRRVAFLYPGTQRTFVEALLQHLRDVRNGWVHADITRANMESHVFELKAFVETLFIFHLRNGRRYKKISAATEYLDSPKDQALLRLRIAEYKRALKDDWKRF